LQKWTEGFYQITNSDYTTVQDLWNMFIWRN
jgi:hypothetical protein